MHHARTFCAPGASIHVVLFFLIGGATTSLNVAGATTYTWTGAAGNNLWSGSTSGVTNWSPNTLPPTTQSIAFTNTTSFNTVNLQTDRTINDVTFGGTQSYTLSGGTLLVSSGNITANGGATATNHEIDTPLAIGASGTFAVSSPATLQINRGVTDGSNNYGLTKTGDGTLTFTNLSSNLYSLTATDGTLNINGASVTTRLINDFGFNFGTTTNVTNGGKLVSAVTGFVKAAGANLPVLTLDGLGTSATGSTYFLAGFGGMPGAIDLRNRAQVSTQIFVVSVGNEGPVASTAMIHSRASLMTSALSIGGAAGALGTITVSDSGTTVQADNILLGGFNTGIFGGTATLTINNSAQVTAGSDTDFFTSTSTLVVDKAALTTARLGTFNGALPLIQLTNSSSSSTALTINNADVTTTDTYAGTIADTLDGAGGILKTGAGTQIFSGHSTYTGGTKISGGTLQTGAGDALPTSGAVTVASGTLDLGGNSEHVGAVTLTNGTISGASGSALLPSSMAVSAGTIGVPIFASGSVNKQTAGTVTDTAAINASALTVSQGILDAQGGISAAASVSSGAQLKLRGNMVGSLSAVSGGTITLTGATVVSGGVTVSGTVDVNNQTVVYNAGDNPQVATTTIAGGLISSADGYTLVGPLSGYGTVASTVSSGTGANSVAASGGTLAVGTYAAADSLVSYTGSLAAGNQQLNLASSGYTTLGSSATIAGGSINSVNGVRVKSTMTLSGNGAVNGPLDNQGTVTGGTGSDILHLTGKVTGGGSFTQNVSFEGSYSPGNSPAAVSLGGPTTFAATNQLLMEIGGTTAGTQFDHINAADALTLGGALKVSLINGFAPAAGESFDLLDFDPSKLSGTFSTIVLPTLSAGLQWNADQLYATGAISVNLLGDYNGNGVVDAADYVIYRAELGRNGIGLSADGNGNNVIDSGDFDIWASHFGGHVGSGAGATTLVPEPSAAALLVTGCACLIAGLRHRA
jgi:fibronectin-binding autotransporter adhesin